MTLGYQAPFKPEQFRNVVVIWTSELNEAGLGSQEVEKGFKRYAREGFGLWPTLAMVIKLGLDMPDLEIEFERVRKIVHKLPAYTGSEFSARQIRAEWSRRVALEYPEGIPEAVAQGLEAVGGYHGLKKKMGSERREVMLSASRLFKRAATSAVSKRLRLEATSSPRLVEVK
jgi:hypothetical protein